MSGLLGQVLPKAGPMGIKTIPGTVINLLGIVWARFVCVCVHAHVYSLWVGPINFEMRLLASQKTTAPVFEIFVHKYRNIIQGGPCVHAQSTVLSVSL